MVVNTAPAGRGFRIIRHLRHAAVRAAAAAAIAAAGLVPALPLSAARADTTAPAPSAGLTAWAGAAPPSFSLDDLAGHRRDLRAFHGKVVLVHFFATWCEPCVAELAALQALARRTRDRLAVLAVDVAEVDLRLRAFFEKHPVDFPVLLDRDRAVTRAWGVSSLPTTVVLDAALAPRLAVERDLDWSHPDILATLKPLFPAP